MITSRLTSQDHRHASALRRSVLLAGTAVLVDLAKGPVAEGAAQEEYFTEPDTERVCQFYSLSRPDSRVQFDGGVHPRVHAERRSVAMLAPPMMISEDFGACLQGMQGAFVFIGNGIGGTPGGLQLQSSRCDFNDELLPNRSSQLRRSSAATAAFASAPSKEMATRHTGVTVPPGASSLAILGATPDRFPASDENTNSV